MTKEELRLLHKCSIHNESEIVKSQKCGCYHCCKIFDASEAVMIEEVEGDRTAWCPHCNMDTVIGDASDYELTPCLLEEMHKMWF